MAGSILILVCYSVADLPSFLDRLQFQMRTKIGGKRNEIQGRFTVGLASMQSLMFA